MNIFLTGGSRGIGNSIKLYFEEKGHYVISPRRTDMDLSDINSIKKYLSEIDLTNIDILINNAGINNLNKLEDITNIDLLETLNINLFSAHELTKHFLPIFKNKKNGKIINIGSIWTKRSMPKRGAYSISKEALYSLTKMTAAENSKYNILCNMVSPGFIETELTFKNNTKEQIENFVKKIPCERMGAPLEVAKLVYFLAIDNTFITGQNILIDGGYTINF